MFLRHSVVICYYFVIVIVILNCPSFTFFSMFVIIIVNVNNTVVNESITRPWRHDWS